MNDGYFMKTALALAERGKGFTSPNPMVGAVVVKNKKIIGRGWHQAVGEAHAEVNAINDAGITARGADMYVTLEPCNHTGRTGPCTKKILEAGISRIVVAMEDPNPDVKGGGINFLKNQGVEVDLGICGEEAAKLNESFVKYIKTKKPFVILKCASTLDGRIATRTGDSKWISGEKSRLFVHELRHAADAIMVGIGTVKTDDPSLTTRLEHVEGRDPVRIILDTELSIDPDAKVLSLESEAETIVVTGGLAQKKKKKLIEKKGSKVIEISCQDGRIDLNALIDFLGESGITSLLIEGGSRVIASSLTQEIIDKVFFFYGPKILGGDDGVPICRGRGPELMSQSMPVKEISIRRFDDDIMIEGYLN